MERLDSNSSASTTVALLPAQQQQQQQPWAQGPTYWPAQQVPPQQQAPVAPLAAAPTVAKDGGYGRHVPGMPPSGKSTLSSSAAAAGVPRGPGTGQPTLSRPPLLASSSSTLSHLLGDVLGALSLSRYHRERSIAQEQRAKQHAAVAAQHEDTAMLLRSQRLSVSISVAASSSSAGATGSSSSSSQGPPNSGAVEPGTAQPLVLGGAPAAGNDRGHATDRPSAAAGATAALTGTRGSDRKVDPVTGLQEVGRGLTALGNDTAAFVTLQRHGGHSTSGQQQRPPHRYA